MAKAKEKAVIISEKPMQFTKKQLANSKKYRDQKDIINSVLSYDQTYTLEQTEQLVDKFLKGKVK